MIIDGRARVFGDNVNTDYIISSSRKRQTIDEVKLVPYLLEGVDPAFASSVQPGDIIVAGRNFGCGSAMEVAATVIRAAGIRAVVAQSFARSFYRNAVNNGLVPVACDTSAIGESDAIRIRVDASSASIEPIGSGLLFHAAPMPAIMLEILTAGGLVPFLRGRGRFAR